MREKLPDRGKDGRDAFTYKLKGLRDNADPRNGAPTLPDVLAMFLLLKIPTPRTIVNDVAAYRSRTWTWTR
jgi:hypothetical protein